MSKTLLSKAMTFLSLVLLVSALHAQANDAATAQSATADTSVQQPTTSKVRIVRLSMVKGAVEIERSRERGFERAIANLPVVERNQLETGTGVAEVEFEDNSSMRLAPNTKVEFPELGRNANGATVSSIHVIQGTVYVSLMKAQNSKAPVNEFALLFGDRKLALDPAAHVRLAIEGAQAKLAVLDGSAHVDGAAGTENIAKKKTATFEMAGEEQPKVANDVEKTEFDGWDHDATQYHSHVASLMGSNSAFGGSPYAYGVGDMAYYGSFVDGGSCGMGMMWRPYFASAAWDPFANGTWAWYQGAGYSWVSPYPWAWTPYHYGSWGFCPGMGWGWTPGGAWYGVNNVAALVPRGSTGTTSTGGPRLPPPHAPLPHEPSLMTVNLKPLTSSMVKSETSFEFHKDSAGLGVPRETLGNLSKFSRETESHGVASTRIYMSAPESGRGMQAGRGNLSSGMSGSLGASMHRGYAPSPSSSSSNSSFSSLGAGGGGGGGNSLGSGRSTTAAPSAPGPSSGGGVRK